MSCEKNLFLLRNLYTGLQAEVIGRYEKAGILEDVTREKREQSLLGGSKYCELLGVAELKECFLKPSEIVECARWEIEEREGSLTAICRGCKIAAMCKKMGNPSPCRLYCLNPIEGMVKALKPEAKFNIDSTLWEEDKCKISINY